MNLQVRGFRISGSGFLVEGVGLQVQGVQGWGFNVFAQGKVHCKALWAWAWTLKRTLEPSFLAERSVPSLNCKTLCNMME